MTFRFSTIEDEFEYEYEFSNSSICEKVTRRKPLGMRLAGAKAFAANPDECRHSVRISRGA